MVFYNRSCESLKLHPVLRYSVATPLYPSVSVKKNINIALFSICNQTESAFSNSYATVFHNGLVNAYIGLADPN